MGSSYVIVAIPSENDYVWQLSSEKVPHVTLLYLGEEPDNVSRIADFLEHAVDTSLNRFGLSVDHRGTLGADEADVLFFDPSYCKKLENFRSYLLQNSDIHTAYNSVEQYPEWTPHLTMGYPTTPAKVDKREYPGTTWVNFDRIALWNDDYEGPEILLKSKQYGSGDEVFYSDIEQYGLAHFGIKGMHWGVRKSQIETAKRLGGLASTAKASLKTSETKKAFNTEVAAKGGLHKVSNDDLKKMLDRLDMEKRYNKFVTEDAKVRSEGRKAGLKLLGEVGKIVLPIALGVALNRATNNRGTFRTKAFVNRPSLGS